MDKAFYDFLHASSSLEINYSLGRHYCVVCHTNTLLLSTKYFLLSPKFFSGLQDWRDRLLCERGDAADARPPLCPPRQDRRRRRARLPMGQTEGATVQVLIQQITDKFKGINLMN